MSATPKPLPPVAKNCVCRLMTINPGTLTDCPGLWAGISAKPFVKPKQTADMANVVAKWKRHAVFVYFSWN